MKFHPFADIFPLIDDDRFDELVADIKEHGQREPIWMYEGKILDGRNRFLACDVAKVEPWFREFEGGDALAFVLSLNIHRRHLTESQRAMVAAKIASLPRGSNQHTAQAASSQRQAADAMHVSTDSVQRARKVIEKGSRALQEAVESGEVPVKNAAAVVDLPKAKQLAAAKKKRKDKKPAEPFEEDQTSPSAPASVELTPPPDFDFTVYEPEDDEAYKQNIEDVMMADDKLAAMREELKQVHRELHAVKASRDHYQSEAGAAVRLVKARDREIERLRKQPKANAENETLRERIAVTEGAPPAVPMPTSKQSDFEEPERPDDIDEDAALAAAEADYMRRVDAIMQADDRLAAASAQLKQQAALIATLETTRDGYMNGKLAVTKMLKAEQSKVARLEKRFKAAEAELEELRERIAVMEETAPQARDVDSAARLMSAG